MVVWIKLRMIYDGQTELSDRLHGMCFSRLEHFDSFPLREQCLVCWDPFDGFVVWRITAMRGRIGIRSL